VHTLMQRGSHGSLATLLTEHTKEPLLIADPLLGASITKQVASGLMHLHELMLVHGCLWPPNVLLSGRSGHTDVKITDFGRTPRLIHWLHEIGEGDEDLEEADDSHRQPYAAPEVIAGLAFGEEADTYSLGCLMARMASSVPLLSHVLSERHPWKVVSRQLVEGKTSVLAGVHASAHAPHLSPTLVHLADRCVRRLESKRPSIESCVHSLEIVFHNAAVQAHHAASAHSHSHATRGAPGGHDPRNHPHPHQQPTGVAPAHGCSRTFVAPHSLPAPSAKTDAPGMAVPVSTELDDFTASAPREFFVSRSASGPEQAADVPPQRMATARRRIGADHISSELSEASRRDRRSAFDTDGRLSLMEESSRDRPGRMLTERSQRCATARALRTQSSIDEVSVEDLHSHAPQGPSEANQSRPESGRNRILGGRKRSILGTAKLRGRAAASAADEMVHI
jgi:serine/threonine protein kinase